MVSDVNLQEKEHFYVNIVDLPYTENEEVGVELV